MVPAQYAQGTLSKSQVFAILRAHRRHTLVIILALLAFTVVTVKLLPKRYTADATVLVNFEANEGTRQAPADLFASYLLTQVDLLQSREVLMSVIDKLGLTNDKQYTAGFKDTGNATLRDWVEKQLRTELTVEQGKGTQLLHVAVTSRDRYKAAQIANAIVEAYQARQSIHSNDPNSDRTVEYTGQLADLKNKVTAAEQRMAEFRQRTGITDVNVGQNNNQTDIETQTLASLEQQLLTAQNARRAAESKNGADQNSSDQVMASQLIQTLKNQLTALQAQLADATATLGPQHPRVLELQSQITTTRRSLEREIQTVSQNGNEQLTSASQLEAKLRRAVEEQRAKLVTTRQLQDEGQKLQLELDSAQTVYKRALDSYDQFMFASTSLASRATPPVDASKPNKIALALAGAFLAVLFGLAGPLFYELYSNRRLHCRDDIERDLGLPVLAEFGPLPSQPSFT
jgi:uncharacterized protein involved in exopolysaccharide biosynthesis